MKSYTYSKLTSQILPAFNKAVVWHAQFWAQGRSK